MSAPDPPGVPVDPDPFALAPPSAARLRLLFLTVAAGALFAGYWFLVLAQDGWRARNLACGRLSQVGDFLDCSTRILVLQTLAPLAGPALVAVLVLLAYVAAPVVITRRHRATPLTGWPEAVRATVEDARLPRTPVLMLSERGLRPWMFTYGRNRVMLAGCVPFYAERERSTVVATLAHELGHLRNKDVGRSYLALFAVAAFALVVAGPPAVAAFLTTESDPAVALTWRGVLVTLLVAGTFSAVVRAREHDADLRARQIRPADVLAWLSGGRRERRHVVRLHPPIGRRLDVVREPGLHMRSSVAEAFTAGVSAGIVVTELGVILQVALPVPAVVAYWCAGLAAAVPICGIVGLGVFRAALSRPAVSGPAFGCGLALGVGLVAGAVLSPRASARWGDWLPGTPEVASGITPDQIPAGTAMWLAAVLPLLTAAVTGWLSLAARAWLPRTGPRAWPYAGALAAVLLAVVLGTWFVAVRLAAAERWTPRGLALLVITPQAALLFGALALVAALSLWPLARTAPAAATAAVLAVLLLAAPLTWLAVPPAGTAAGTSTGSSTSTAPTRAAGSAGTVPTTATPAPAALPDSTQAGAICLGLYTTGVAAFGDPADHSARSRLGELLRASDDSLLRQAGDLFARSARARSGDLGAVAWTAFVRRCDNLNRYHDHPAADPAPPFPTESW
ncbi:M48 family metalloprotease [Nonomuraea sp. NPDC048916]|uniref:M48 family metalloprotease n=1 Tax=Nonomuraea sp. NPDC048916 TaxID=3154232 RepID=UPI0033EAAD8C